MSYLSYNKKISLNNNQTIKIFKKLRLAVPFKSIIILFKKSNFTNKIKSYTIQIDLQTNLLTS